ncbi:hypothetical protein AO263_36075 [Pseudomonas sp. NZIPFR-PS5]|nr:hypothetical protein AO263_36075 [Pseudomonas sp. NZIPFR-PS5]
MGGWTRLWLVGCVLLAIPALTTGLSYWPTADNDSALHQLNVRSNELSLSIIKTAMDYPESSPGVIDDEHNLDQVNHRIRQEEERYRERVNSLWSRQLACVLLFSAIWIGACGLLYVLGLIGGWVVKGFRSDGKSAS